MIEDKYVMEPNTPKVAPPVLHIAKSNTTPHGTLCGGHPDAEARVAEKPLPAQVGRILISAPGYYCPACVAVAVEESIQKMPPQSQALLAKVLGTFNTNLADIFVNCISEIRHGVTYRLSAIVVPELGRIMRRLTISYGHPHPISLGIAKTVRWQRNGTDTVCLIRIDVSEWVGVARKQHTDAEHPAAPLCISYRKALTQYLESRQSAGIG